MDSLANRMRLNEPAVRQFEQQRRFDLCIVVDAYAANASVQQHAETAISLAATIITKLAISPSNRIVLGIAGMEHEAVLASGSRADRNRMLVMLAGIAIGTAPDIVAAIGKSVQLADSTRDLIVVSSRSESEAVAGQDRNSTYGSQTYRQPKVRWIDVRQQTFAGHQVELLQ